MFIELIGDNGVKEVSLADNKIRYMVDHLIREHFILSITTKNNKQKIQTRFHQNVCPDISDLLHCVRMCGCVVMHPDEFT